MGTYLPSNIGVQVFSNRIGSVRREVWKIGRNHGNYTLTALQYTVPYLSPCRHNNMLCTTIADRVQLGISAK